MKLKYIIEKFTVEYEVRNSYLLFKGKHKNIRLLYFVYELCMLQVISNFGMYFLSLIFYALRVVSKFYRSYTGLHNELDNFPLLIVFKIVHLITSFML